ncbi:baseplate assembly protein [Serratia sp. Leaf50]|uniref:GPW/gp25 family protein n=1 Tax=Rouxiella sp. S1S-2 TaxID=2653856 RepID=UPI0006FF02F1|nr:GPW/gp25 family protein [Rouxiella sp. S1S-2]KAB7896022.1 baseplate assembly protein [Rouxiella sp. S1S-2]KQN46878.1 baseplate assembly protein [Serratia sp. Leaf50]
MQGVSAKTGKRLSGTAHLRQSIIDILTTPKGSRVLRRDYGSDLHDRVDNPLDESNRIRIISATATALARWEPRLTVTRIQVIKQEESVVEISIEGTHKETGLSITFNRIPLNGHQS